MDGMEGIGWLQGLPWTAIYVAIGVALLVGVLLRSFKIDRNAIGLLEYGVGVLPAVIGMLAAFGATFATLWYTQLPMGVHALITLLLVATGLTLISVSPVRSKQSTTT